MLGRWLRKLPGYYAVRSSVSRGGLPAGSVEDIFTFYYRHNTWGGVSRSGVGSDPEQTRGLDEVLSKLLKRLGVRTFLDAPCGDFAWMSRVDLDGVDYIGADIVRPMIDELNKRFGTPSRRFVHGNVIAGALPQADMVLSRDCLVHLSNAEVLKAIANIRASGSRWLLATTYPGQTYNNDIATGHWRPINLTRKPFHLGPCVELIRENCTEAGGSFSDKSLGLWDLHAAR
jgi:hypothetical protein